MTPPTVNAYYNPLENNINFPAGILQPPFFDARADAAVNFGAAGAVIGHELTHGFDDEGRQFDAQGNLKDWWTPADAKAFEERAACFVDEYSQLHGGRRREAERQADARREHRRQRRPAASRLMALSRDAERRTSRRGRSTASRRSSAFFVGWGQMWCENARPERARLLAQTNPHSPGHVPRQRRRLEHAGVPEGVRVQGRRADGAQEPVPRLVTTRSGRAGGAGMPGGSERK